MKRRPIYQLVFGNTLALGSHDYLHVRIKQLHTMRREVKAPALGGKAWIHITKG